ncbi:hypothetical protein OSB04_un001031 [Centaurea solstitialis]|uniref:Reverse transcriptase zinc-binding domain-containing protein n=1 Tax=Centaurea solstitialis TaxID=347529 RepID=A0AA38W229_9ASTR|nr:hypothetical protein OSB04_un001031 [Centaurea solstitialis]
MVRPNPITAINKFPNRCICIKPCASKPAISTVPYPKPLETKSPTRDRFTNGLPRYLALSSTVRDVLMELNGQWPNDWIVSNPSDIPNQLPTLDDGTDDVVAWRGVNNVLTGFSVKEVWRSIDGNHVITPWVKFVWFKHHVPKHAFCMWTACHKRLPTQDRLSLWKENPPDFLCPLCNQIPDSHDHLFFTCSFSRDGEERGGFMGYPDVWSTIMEYLQDNRGPKMLIQRLALSATVYYIWRERNCRLFRGAKQNSLHVFKMIRSSVMDTMAWRTVTSKSV